MAEDTRTILQALNAAVEMQRRSAEAMANAASRFDRYDAEFVKATRQRLKAQEDLAAFRSDMTAFRSDVTARLDALARRMEELENLVDRSAEEARAARSEIVTLENQILNAVQTGLNNMADAMI